MLDECVLRVPDDFDATEELLKYGLLGTSWEVLQRIDEENADKLPFRLDGEEEEHSENNDESNEKQNKKVFSGE